jgi:hypothetical protein
VQQCCYSSGWETGHIISGIPEASGTDSLLESGFSATLQGQSPKENDESSVESWAVDVIRRNLPNTVVADLEVSVWNSTSALRVDSAMRKLAFPFALMIVGAIQGCATGPSLFAHTDPSSCYEPGSDEWWAEKALLPPGERQKCKKGKIWPARPRSTEPKQQFSHVYHSEHYWPLPYVCQDRAAVRDVMEMQVSLGWQEETTVYDRHFDPVSNALTRTGQLHLERIVYVVPPERRAVYVQSTHDSGMDAVRMEIVQAAVASLSNGSCDVPVSLRECQQLSRAASEVQAINTMYNSSIPSPRISSAGTGSALNSTTP